MTPSALVSVVIPVYNGATYLAEAIASARAQTYRPLEIIVVDDGSTDDSAEIARGTPGVRYCHHTHAGLSAARNRGVQEARGMFLAFLDADDLWPPDKIARQMVALEACPELDIVYGYAQQFCRPTGATGADENIGGPLPALVPGASIIRAEVFQRVGLFDPRWRLGEFIDWYARAEEAGVRSRLLADVLLKRRVHTENIGIRERGARTDYARIIKAMLERRRTARHTTG